ncbi:4-phosphoerythronate dehydrogenase PdxB [Labilibacter marinus]|uniref:4-phosphoerythronate dehydrogenase PdxB n=1 Tax=Labilibacter marinus TaxID=1477105 RepID=UPI001E367D40|nr:4-phosphoerythronate dehydrogenase PdxB [Labilibacter marinus]
MINIIADNKIPFLEGILEPYANITYLAGAKTDADTIKNADALITRTRTKCSSENLAGSQVKMIATATIGFDHIDTAFCESNNIAWTNAPGCNSGSVKQYIGATLATIAHQLKFDLTDKTLGIVGVGNVGSKVADFAQAVGIKVLLNDPPRARKEGSQSFVELDELIEKSDFITFHVPLQRDGEDVTYHLGNTALFKQCKKDAIIINSSRGEIINNSDLLEAINKGLIGNAVLDVWENEPEMNLELLDKTIIATPHIAGYSADGKANGTANSVQAISKHFDLPLKNWYPDSIPAPAQACINIDASELNLQEVWIKAVLHTYSIQEDDTRFRTHPETFEHLRGSYPIRREFHAYKVSLKNGTQEMATCLNKIGFKAVHLI